MNLTCDHLPIAHKHKKNNYFYETHPKANDLSRNKLAILFLEKTNCTTILPKLPSMIKASETK